jgi:hypothetical protein
MTKTKHWNLGIWDIRKKSEFWKELAKRKNADFKSITTVSKDLNRLELYFEYEKVKVIFTESDTKPLFIECSFNSDIGQIWFEISKVDSIEKTLSLFSKHKINSQNKEFNSKYLIKAKDSQKIRHIINNKNILDIILRENLTFIGGKPGKNGAFNLTLNIHRNINNLEQLEGIYNLTITMIDILKRRKNVY